MKYFLSILGRLIPVILSFLLLAAHFSRQNQLVPLVFSLAVTGFLFVRREWSVRVIQAVLVMGGIEWISSMLIYVAQRKAASTEWTRLAVILSVVALFTMASGLVFFGKKIKGHYQIK